MNVKKLTRFVPVAIACLGSLFLLIAVAAQTVLIAVGRVPPEKAWVLSAVALEAIALPFLAHWLSKKSSKDVPATAA